MKNDERLTTGEDSSLVSQNITSPPLDTSTQGLDDREYLPLAKGHQPLPWYLRHVRNLNKYFKGNEKKVPFLKFAFYFCGILLFLVLLKTLVFDREIESRNIAYNSNTGSNNGFKTYTSPFLDIHFENPTAYSEVWRPWIEKEDYIPRLHMTCYFYSKDHLNIIIRDADKERYELPHEHPFPFPKDVDSVLPEDSDFLLHFQLEPFNLVIKRKSNEEIIFNLADRFVFTNLYLEVSFMMPSHEIYGLGERISPLQFKDGTYSLFIVDRIGQIDHGKSGYNSQGHHSMYLCKEYSDMYHVTFFKNTNAQEVVLKDRKLTWKITGGVLDFHFFLGSSPEDALQKYHSYIGGWTLPAFWHLGYHQSKSWENQLEDVLENFEKNEIPMDVIWSDLDIYEDNQNFNFNANTFPHTETTEMLKKYNKKWITSVQPHIPTQKSNPCWEYEEDNLLDLIIKDGITKEPLKGYGLSGLVYFIDFLNPKSDQFWSYMLDFMNDRMPISGFSLDANELTNLMARFESTRSIYYHNIEQHKYYKLPFYPGGKNLYDLPIVQLDAIHHGDIEEFNVRSLNALYQSLYTHDYLKKKEGNYFPFVLSRGNMFGSGQFSFHFVPDIRSSWESLRSSLGPILTYPIFGIPVIGADICGSINEHQPNAELCARWHQLAVFYTFARNHYDPRNKLDSFEEPDNTHIDTSFTSIKNSMLLRYSMLKQFYTYFFTRPGQQLRVGTVMRPLFFEFHRKSRHDRPLPPYGDRVYEEQFMMSDAIMAAPVLHEGRNDLDIYFPYSKWFDLRDGKEVPVRGQFMNIPAPVDGTVPHFLRDGKMIFKQDVTGVKNTEDLNNVFNIIVGLPDFVTRGKTKKAEAVGNILDVPNYSEEVIYNQCTEKNCLMNVTMTCSYDNNTFSIDVRSISESSDRTENPVEIKELHLLGAPKEFFASGKETGKVELQGKSIYEYKYDESTQVLKIFISNNLILDNDTHFIFEIKI